LHQTVGQSDLASFSLEVFAAVIWRQSRTRRMSIPAGREAAASGEPVAGLI